MLIVKKGSRLLKLKLLKPVNSQVNGQADIDYRHLSVNQGRRRPIRVSYYNNYYNNLPT